MLQKCNPQQMQFPRFVQH
ncbi:unnamed protein product [Knipowitschia caucasica]